MENTLKLTNDLFYIGSNDRRINLFENVYPVQDGVSYNSYLLDDEKTVLFDTVDKHFSLEFFTNLKSVLKGRNLDYFVINHLEPDHSALVAEVLEKYPTATIVCNAKIKQMLYQFFDLDENLNFNIVKEGDTLSTGRHNFTFVMAPMVHWPEVMVTYDLVDKILFSADAFGSFGALNGNIIDSDTDFDSLIPEYRRYYCNIVGKYGAQVTALLNKASNLEIKMVCPLHGLVLKENILKLVDLYSKWADYTPETNSALIVYASVYGGTQTASEVLASKLAQEGIKSMKIYDVSRTHYSFILADAFKYSHIILSSITYNNGIFSEMDCLVRTIKEHNLQKRTFAFIENGSWMPKSADLMKEILSSIPNTKFLDEKVTLKSTLKSNQLDELDKLAKKIAIDIKEKDLVKA